MANVNLNILTRLEGVESAIQELQNLGKKAEASLKKTEESTKKAAEAVTFFGINVGKVNNAFGALEKGIDFVKGVASLFSAPIAAAAESEEAINELNTALALSGKFSEETSKSIQNLAEEIQATTKFEDDAIISTAAFIQNLARLDKDGLQRATKASVDLAAALKIDLQTAAQLVGKAAEGNVDAFKRYGVEIRKGKNDTETFANTLETLENRFGGAARSQVNTFSGAITQLSNAFGNVLEEVGNVVVKNNTLIKIVQQVTKFSNALTTVIQENSSTFADLATNGILFAVDAFKVFLLIFDPIDAVITTVITTIKLLGLNIGALAGSIQALANLDFDFFKDLKSDNIALINKEIDGFKGRSKVFGDVREQVDKLSQSLKDTASRNPAGEIASGFEKISKNAATAGSAIDNDLIKKLESLEEKFKSAGLTRIESLNAEKDAALKQLDEIANEDIRLRERVASLRERIEKDSAAKIKAEEIKQAEEAAKVRLELIKKVASAASSFLSAISPLIESPKLIKTNVEAFVNAEKKQQDIRIKEITDANSDILKAEENLQKQRINEIKASFEAGEITEAQYNATVEQLEFEFQERKTALEAEKALKLEAVSIEHQANLDRINAEAAAQDAANEADRKSKEATVKLFADGFSAIADSFFPGIGGVVAQLVTISAQGAEAIKTAFTTIISQAGSVLTSIIESLPVLLTELVRGAANVLLVAVGKVDELLKGLLSAIPEILSTIIAKVPEIINGLIASLNDPRFIFDLAKSMAEAFINTVIQGIVGFLNGILGVINTILGIVTLGAVQIPQIRTDVVKLAEGGTIPSGFPNDTFMAGLSSGETVVNKDLSNRLDSFLEKSAEQKVAQAPASNIAIYIGNKKIAEILRDEIQSGRVVLA